MADEMGLGWVSVLHFCYFYHKFTIKILVWIRDCFCIVLHVLSFCLPSNSMKTVQSIGFLDQISGLEALQIRGSFLIVSPLYLVNQWHSEAATWALDMVAIIYHCYADSRELLVHQEFFYTYQFIPKVSASKLKRQHITKVSAQKYYNSIFCINCGLLNISFSLVDSLLNNHKSSSR